MKLEQIPGDYDNVDQRALELLKELYANIHMRDFYIRDSISGEELHGIWNMMADGKLETI
jgi:hypothetical protein